MRARTVQAKLYYVHDPMCSWCWAFRSTWDKTLKRLPENIQVVGVLGGLASDTEEPMPRALQSKIQQIWKTIQQHVPGTEFNYDFWRVCNPRRATYAACRAVIAAAKQGAEFEQRMILAIQTAYYLRAQNPSEEAVLSDLALSLKLEQDRFTHDLGSADTEAELQRQIAFSRELGVQGFPSLLLEKGPVRQLLGYDYNDPDVLLRELSDAADV